MKVLLKEDVDNLGYAGEVMDVADGYGRNYLIPQGYAVKATPGVLKQATVWRERAAVRMAELQSKHQSLAEQISDTKLIFTARAGETGKLYGSVTTGDIVEKLNLELGTDIDRRNVISDPLRQLGEHSVTIRLSRDFNPQIKVYIHPFIDEDEEIEKSEAEPSEESEILEEAEQPDIIDSVEVEDSDQDEEIIPDTEPNDDESEVTEGEV